MPAGIMLPRATQQGGSKVGYPDYFKGGMKLLKKTKPVPKYLNTDMSYDQELTEWMSKHKIETGISYQNMVIFGLELYRQQQAEIARIKSGATQMNAEV